MRTALVGVLLAGLSGGCALSHSLDAEVDTAIPDAIVDDAGQTSADAAGPVVTAPDAPTLGVECGPNRCLSDEVCCNAACGVCAFEDECVDRGCPEP